MRKLFGLFLLTSASFARADTCAMPSTIGFSSDNGEVAVRIEVGWPEAWGPTPSRTPRKCVATITRWDEKDRSYRFLRSVVLRNPAGPGEALISNDARFLVTFDEVCESGMSENDVVIYDLEKDITVACSIEDFLPKTHRESLPRSISHIDWRDSHPYLNEDRKVWIRPSCNIKGDFSIVIDLTTYSITLWPPQPQ
jgi:hypothetical protein